MKKFVLLLALMLSMKLLPAQDTTSLGNNYYLQKEIYSNILGFKIDTMIYPAMYDTMMEWFFTSYCYGGRSKNGIDCSDFSSVIYEKAFQMKLTGSSADVYKKSRPVEKKDLREGDLVFFKIKNNRISHMGIYLCKNKFAHASVKNGVIISDLDEAYYKKHFYKGGRVLND